MWDLFNEIFKSHGFSALLISIEAAAIVYLFRLNQKRQDQIIKLHEKRLEDATENKNHYEELTKNLDKSIDLLIKIFKQRDVS